MPAPSPDYLTIGRITAPRGIKGEVKVQVLTDFPERFGLLGTVYLGPDHRPIEIESSRLHQRWALLMFVGRHTRESVEDLRGLQVDIPYSEAMPLGPDMHYEHQIVGLSVWTEEGERLGTVREIIYTGSNDVYVVRGSRGEVLIPALKDVVLEIDLDEEKILVRLMEGLI
jgi:16S rRNA processing protein RimM